MKNLLAILLCFGLAFYSHAQEDTDYGFESMEKKNSSYQAYLFNFHLDRASGLTNLLLANGFPNMNQYGNEIGVLMGFGKGSRKITPLFKVSYYNRSTLSSATTNNSATITGWGAGMGLEYNLIETKLFFVRPQFILNFNTYTLNFVQNLGDVTIDGLLNSDYNEYSFRSGQVPLQAGINLGAKLNLCPASFGIIIGAGYILNWTNDNWKIGMNTIVQDKINLSSPYVSAGIITSMN